MAGVVVWKVREGLKAGRDKEVADVLVSREGHREFVDAHSVP